jgi:hypothetical protein
MIGAVAFCPHPPVLIPEVAQGAAPELDDLRTACRTAIRRIATPDRQLVVYGAGPVSAVHSSNTRGTLAGFGVPLEVSLGTDEPGPVELPLSLTIGAWLLRDALGSNCGAVGYSVGPDGDPILGQPQSTAPLALLVMGDGSARRSTSAPGYFDERAAEFDAHLAAILRSGSMPHIDVVLGDELLATAPRVWNAVAPRLHNLSFRTAELLYDAAPYGVGYFVAAWTDDG